MYKENKIIQCPILIIQFCGIFNQILDTHNVDKEHIVPITHSLPAMLNNDRATIKLTDMKPKFWDDILQRLTARPPTSQCKEVLFFATAQNTHSFFFQPQTQLIKKMKECFLQRFILLYSIVNISLKKFEIICWQRDYTFVNNISRFSHISYLNWTNFTSQQIDSNTIKNTI